MGLYCEGTLATVCRVAPGSRWLKPLLDICWDFGRSRAQAENASPSASGGNFAGALDRLQALADEATRHLRTLRETVEADEGPMFVLVLVIPRA